MNSRLETLMRGMAFDEWGVCRFHDALPLLPVRSKARIPQGARSVIVVLFGYYIGDFPNRNISYYAIVDDYHTIVRAVLETAADKLRALYADEQFVPFVDASPVAEVRAAYLAGLGDIGMNGQLLNRTYASRCFIGEIVTTAELEPSVTGIDALDALVAETLAKITNEDMTTYEKVVACYDYLTDNMRYGSSMYHLNVPLGDTTCADIFYTYGEVDGFGAVALTSNYGLCNGYAAGFILLTRAIGLDADLVTGQTRSAGGGYAYHKWAEITIDGTAYAFDPQLDQSYAQKGLGEYSNFCKTYEQINGRYIKA